MNLVIISFTSSGKEISHKIKNEIKAYYKEEKQLRVTEINKYTFKGKLSNHMKEIFNDNDALIFISSTGIAVRLIAPFIEDKCSDPAVIVIDDLGKFTISLLSGHIGGANDLSLKVSQILRNKAIITTASDARGLDAVDTFAMKNNFYIECMEDAKTLTSLMVEGERVLVLSEVKVELNYGNKEVIYLENQNILEFLKDNKVEKDRYPALIVISSMEDIKSRLKEDGYSGAVCLLRPKNLNLGIGCRRGKGKDEIFTFLEKIFAQHNLSKKSVVNIGTIDIKHDEEGIVELSKYLKAKLTLFSKSDLEGVSGKFRKSEFVKKNVGVSSVCEPSAYLLSKHMIVDKQVLNGITIAVSRSE